MIVPRKEKILLRCRQLKIKPLPLDDFFSAYDTAIDDHFQAQNVDPNQKRRIPQQNRRGNCTPEEDAMLLKYVLANERTSWSGSLIYRRFAQLNPWRSEQSWRNRFVKYMKRHVENFLMTGSIDSSAPAHIAQAIRDEFAPEPARPANRAAFSEHPRVRAPPRQPVIRNDGDSDDEMFRDDRPAQFSDNEEEEPQPKPTKRRKIAILEKSATSKESQQGDEASTEADEEAPLFYGSQSPLTSPYNTTTEQGAVPSSAEEITSSLPTRSQRPAASRVGFESRDSVGGSSPSLGSPTYYSTAPSA